MAYDAIGSNWLQLVSYQTTAPVADLVARTFGPSMHAVKGKWGSGRVYSAGLMSVLVTKQGAACSPAPSSRACSTRPPATAERYCR